MEQPNQPQGRGANALPYCYCPKCGYKGEHQRGTPCTEKKCPKCGAQMLGENCKE